MRNELFLLQNGSHLVRDISRWMSGSMIYFLNFLYEQI